MKTLDYINYLVRRTKTLEQIVDEQPSVESHLLLIKKLDIEENAVEKQENMDNTRAEYFSRFFSRKGLKT